MQCSLHDPGWRRPRIFAVSFHHVLALGVFGRAWSSSFPGSAPHQFSAWSGSEAICVDSGDNRRRWLTKALARPRALRSGAGLDVRFFLLEATRCLQAAADGDQQVDSGPAQVLQPEITKRCSRQKTQYRDTPPSPVKSRKLSSTQAGPMGVPVSPATRTARRMRSSRHRGIGAIGGAPRTHRSISPRREPATAPDGDAQDKSPHCAAKVSQSPSRPLLTPLANHSTRCFELPCVNV